jgi:uncharacterized protein involved in tolerance to divalent cations
MSVDSAFKGAGLKPGVQVWRIENKAPKVWPEKEHGKFFEGDAYICLKTTQKPESSSFTWDIFFWLGDECSQDEQGIAAYKTVELDELLGGGPVQHRETQGKESDQFLQLFSSVQYAKGGVASGFNKVERGVYETQLLRLKGKKVVRVSPVEVSGASLNAGDVFVIVESNTITQWNGSESNKKEKSKALEITKSIRDDERGGKAKIIVIDQGSETPEFWKALGGQTPIQPAIMDDDVQVAEKLPSKLIQVSDASGKIEATEIASGELHKQMLKTEDVFIVDNFNSIYVWVGKEASKEEKKSGMQKGIDYLADQTGRPKSIKLLKIVEDFEPPAFKANFSTWSDPLNPTGFGYTPQKKKRESTSAVEAVADVMGRLSGMLTGQSPSGVESFEEVAVDVYRIEDFKEVPQEKEFFGQFYAGDSYVVKVKCNNQNKIEYIVYFWLGRKSTADEKGAAALIATRMDDELTAAGTPATQVRVVMGKEPSHFVRLFKGKMVVRSGGKASGFKNREDADSYDTDGTELYHIRGSLPEDTRAVQVAEVATSLNAGDCFCLLTPATVFVWQGAGANESEVNCANVVASTLQFKRECEQFMEGAETDLFWEALGGKVDYPQEKVALDVSREPMLFHCSNETGRFQIEPIFDYAQPDLEEDDVFVLDTYTTIYVWMGSEANETEKRMSLESAMAYLKAQGYSEDTAITTVKSGAEPFIFTCNFLGWDSTQSKKFVDPYEAKLQMALASNPPDKEPEPTPAEPAPRSSLSGNYTEPGRLSLSYDILKSGKDDRVDPTKKEQYLTDTEFENVLGSPRSEFDKLKPWKQAQIKKSKGLF